MFYDIHLGTCFFLNFGLPWVFVAAPGFPLVVVSRGYSVTGFSLQQLLLLRSTGPRGLGFSNCSTQAQQLWHTSSVATCLLHLIYPANHFLSVHRNPLHRILSYVYTNVYSTSLLCLVTEVVSHIFQLQRMLQRITLCIYSCIIGDMFILNFQKQMAGYVSPVLCC